MTYMPIPVLAPLVSGHESVFFILILYAKIVTLEFIGLHPYICVRTVYIHLYLLTLQKNPLKLKLNDKHVAINISVI